MIRIISFSDRGEALALRLAEALGGRVDRAGGTKNAPGQESQGTVEPAGEANAEGASAEGPSVPEGRGQFGPGRVSLAAWTREAHGSGRVSLDTRTREALGPGRVSLDTWTREALGPGRVSLAAWTKEAFDSAEALIFVGAAGIAVRAIAPHVKSKASDPAVVVVDETGAYAIPILSGHLGGANRLAREIAAVIGAEAVITTATDRNGLWAVDDWARENGCRIPDPRGIKRVSAKVLRGEKLQIFSEFPVSGGLLPELALTDDPNTADVIIGVHRYAGAPGLLVVPQVSVLGIGCRRGTSAEVIESHFETLLAENDIHPLAVTAAASIDLKAEEPGILEFCGRRGFSFSTWTAEELSAVPGDFHGSDFVARTVGTDNVCERSAVLASGGRVAVPKCAGEGVTMALAVRPFRVVFDKE